MSRTARRTVLAAALGLPVAAWCAVAIFDPPAVRDFPDHEQAVAGFVGWRDLVAIGRRLFVAKFNELDGATRPTATGDSKPTPRPKRAGQAFNRLSGPDANSCAGCHNDPGVGGAGDFATNVFVGAHFADPPADRVTPEITNERNTTALFGAGLIEMLAREMSAELRAQRSRMIAEAVRSGRSITEVLRAKSVEFGRLTARSDGSLDTGLVEGVDDDLIVKPFGAKGVAVSLREFTVFALNQHHGIQAIERFGWERTGRHDFDGDGVRLEFSRGQVTAMVAFQATLPAPTELVPEQPGDVEQYRKGRAVFMAIGCDGCHRTAMPLEATEFTEPGPFNRPGTLAATDGQKAVHWPLAIPPSARTDNRPVLVNAFTDLKRHRICDQARPKLCNERRKQDNVATDQFMTAKLWDLATSAPYCHRGDCLTVTDAIDNHGGEATTARIGFERLAEEEKRSLIAYLLTQGAGSGDVRQ